MTDKAPRVSRRSVLGMAAAGAAGAAALRFTVFNGQNPAQIASATGPNGAWRSPLGTSRGLASHLLRRAGFGYSDADLDSASAMSYDDLVDSVVGASPQPLGMPADVTAFAQVDAAWLQHMAMTSAQFPERMTLFWHGHLTSGYRKANNTPYVYVQNSTYRTYGLTDMRTLLRNAVTDPLMMRYLDLDESTGTAPNENFAREFLELFTLGIGNFSEDDVKAAAKAFAGLRIAMFDASGKRQRVPQAGLKGAADRKAAAQAYSTKLAGLIGSGATFRGFLMPSRAYDGTITLLGKTGTFTPDDAVDVVLAQSAFAPFIANKVLTYFVTPEPSSSLVASTAATFRSGGYDIRALMASVFRSDDFRAAANYRSLVRSPVDLAVATMRAVGTTTPAAAFEAAAPAMGQVLYDVPTVAGWPVNGAWLSSATVLARINAAASIVGGGAPTPDPTTAVANQLDGVVGDDFARVFNSSTTNADRWYAILASPEFNLK